MSDKAKISVVGSYAVGMTMSCGKFPRAGETVMGRGFQMLHGGKGSNQAIAVARLGGTPTFMSAVGEDSFGRAALGMLEDEGVDTRFVKRTSEGSTGVGFIIVAESGDNEIVIDLGANNGLQPSDVEPMSATIAASDLLLVQLEINPVAVIRAIEIAHRVGTPIILNPAPFQKLPDEIVRMVSYVTPNETEAAAMLGREDARAADGRELASAIFDRFGVNTIVTLGEQGAFVRTPQLCERVPTCLTKVVDSTGAGDTFSAALAVALGEGKPILTACQFATRAASMSVEVWGVVPSIPYRKVVDERLAGRSEVGP